MDKSYVSRITKQLLHEKYIFCANPRGSPKLYKPTDKPLPSVDPELTMLRGGRNTTSYGVCRVHSIARSYLLERPPKQKVNWDSTWVNKGTTYSQLRQVFDIGMVTIRMLKGQNEKYGRLIIWLPEKYLSYEQLETDEKILDSYCQHVANWFMKNYECRLGLPEIYQKPHFAFPDDPDFIHSAKKFNISVGDDYWVDNSDGHAEWETNDVRLAKTKMQLPKRVMILEKQMNDLKNSISQLTGKIDVLIESFNTPHPPDPLTEVFYA